MAQKRRQTHTHAKNTKNCKSLVFLSLSLPLLFSFLPLFYPSFYLFPPCSPSLSFPLFSLSSLCSLCLFSNPIRQRHRAQISLLAEEEQRVSTEGEREREGRERGKERERETEIDCWTPVEVIYEVGICTGTYVDTPCLLVFRFFFSRTHTLKHAHKHTHEHNWSHYSSECV